MEILEIEIQPDVAGAEFTEYYPVEREDVARANFADYKEDEEYIVGTLARRRLTIKPGDVLTTEMIFKALTGCIFEEDSYEQLDAFDRNADEDEEGENQ